MTREQMELLLNYFDAKLALLDFRHMETHYYKEFSMKARKARQELLASLPPASEN